MSQKRAVLTQEYDYYAQFNPNVQTKKRRTFKKRKYKPFPKSRTAFDRAVRTALYKQVETKCAVKTATEQTVSTIAATPTIIDFPLNVAIGTSQDARVGNKTRLVRQEARVIFHNNSTSVGSAKLVRCAVLGIPQGAGANNSAIESELFEGSGDFDVVYSGSLSDMIKRFNPQVVKTQQDTLLRLAPANGTNTDNVQIFNFAKMYNQDLHYTDADTSQPENYRYILLLFTLLSDADESVGQNVEYTYELRSFYKDL